jgi:hypothetical protein
VIGEGRVEKGPPMPFSVRSGFLPGSFVVGWGLGPSRPRTAGIARSPWQAAVWLSLWSRYSQAVRGPVPPTNRQRMIKRHGPWMPVFVDSWRPCVLDAAPSRCHEDQKASRAGDRPVGVLAQRSGLGPVGIAIQPDADPSGVVLVRRSGHLVRAAWPGRAPGTGLGRRWVLEMRLVRVTRRREGCRSRRGRVRPAGPSGAVRRVQPWPAAR